MKYLLQFVRRAGRFIADWWLLFLLLGIMVGLLAFLCVRRWAPEVPQCPEDAIILGGGNYEAGYWDYLYCGPAVDDLD